MKRQSKDLGNTVEATIEEKKYDKDEWVSGVTPDDMG